MAAFRILSIGLLVRITLFMVKLAMFFDADRGCYLIPDRS